MSKLEELYEELSDGVGDFRLVKNQLSIEKSSGSHSVKLAGLNGMDMKHELNKINFGNEKEKQEYIDRVLYEFEEQDISEDEKDRFLYEAENYSFGDLYKEGGFVDENQDYIMGTYLEILHDRKRNILNEIKRLRNIIANGRITKNDYFVSSEGDFNKIGETSFFNSKDIREGLKDYYNTNNVKGNYTSQSSMYFVVNNKILVRISDHGSNGCGGIKSCGGTLTENTNEKGNYPRYEIGEIEFKDLKTILSKEKF